MRIEHLNNGDLYAFKCYFVFFDVFFYLCKKNRQCKENRHKKYVDRLPPISRYEESRISRLQKSYNTEINKVFQQSFPEKASHIFLLSRRSGFTLRLDTACNI